jgi:hypothetical protein
MTQVPEFQLEPLLVPILKDRITIAVDISITSCIDGHYLLMHGLPDRARMEGRQEGNK